MKDDEVRRREIEFIARLLSDPQKLRELLKSLREKPVRWEETPPPVRDVQ